MRLLVIPPPVPPEVSPDPRGCSPPDGDSRSVPFRPAVRTPPRDTRRSEVVAPRDQGGRRGRTCRGSPVGGSPNQPRARRQGMAVLVDGLGLR